MARIMLVRPPFARALNSSVYLTYPLGPMLVASMLKSRGHDVVIYHDDVSNPQFIPDNPAKFKSIVTEDVGYDHFESMLNNFNPDVVGMSFRTADADAAYGMARVARSKGIRVVGGGIHPSLLPYEAVEHLDAVVVGEGEHVEVAGVFEGSYDGVFVAPVVENLDLVVADRNCVIGGERYSKFLTGMIETQRGCPYACSYCAAPSVFGKKVRLRDPGAVREEVESLSTRSGRIIDDSFGVVREHGLAICRELGKTKYSWVCDMALQNIDAEMCAALVSGGCTGINVGLESGAERWRSLSGKRIELRQAEFVLELATDAGLGVVYYFIVGFPGETYDELRSTIRWANELKLRGAKPCISILTPYPKTKVWDLTEGRRDETVGWSNYFHQSNGQGYAAVTPDQWEGMLKEVERING